MTQTFASFSVTTTDITDLKHACVNKAGRGSGGFSPPFSHTDHSASHDIKALTEWFLRMAALPSFQHSQIVKDIQHYSNLSNFVF